jgi:hypothetical protein
MLRRRNARTAIAVSALSVLAVSGATLASPAAATHESNLKRAVLHPLNDSGVHGHASVRYGATHINAKVDVTGAAASLPHAQHIHFGKQALHECPTARLDTDRNFRLNVAEGVPAYGPIAVSFTTTGNTADASGLAVDRMPVAAANGSYSYYRTGIRLVASGTESAASIRAGIAAGQGVVVIHGVDHNGNGQYDMAGAGASELNPAVPAEATDPAACGLLK